ncbi:sialoadhesin-like [Centroberyx affinis]|uniref:sialoadhesin-like n=1 Tax=Centroberyx affinis TaxID=166261 RepID=UPI003A5BA306
MSFTAAASGFLVFLLSVPVVQGQDDWGVTCTSTEICALKGSTVDILCTYRHPASIDDLPITVVKTLWFTKEDGDGPVDLRTDSEYEGRVEYHGDQKKCSLRITDLRETDSAVYKFRFITNHPNRKFTSPSGVTLTVTALQVMRYWTSSQPQLDCESSCRPAGHPSYIWSKNGQNIKDKTSSPYTGYIDSTCSYSCAVKGQEASRSPSVCVYGKTCSKVTYTNRTICALKGSSVHISCTYNIYKYDVISKFWFSPQYSYRWKDSSQPEDLRGNSEYAGRAQQFEEKKGRSTLKITDLRESDSAEYRFKFKTQNYEWGSDFPGTTLTVTALQVHVTRSSVDQFSTWAELKCHSSCRLAGRPSYVWYKNGQNIKEGTTSSYTVLVSPSGEIVEGSSVTLTCRSDANPAATYTWYKENGNPDHKPFSTEPQFHFVSIQSSVSGEYYCAAENELGGNRSASISINVKYGPKNTSVLVSPSGEIVQGSSVTLTCSSDANPAATYTWYKENRTLHEGPEEGYNFTSISSEDSGTYHCQSENQYRQLNSSSLFIDVQYGPKNTSVLVSPSGEILEGSSVNLTCSSDANPAATYTWYKENEASLKASEQILAITDLRPEHSGNYYCEAHNKRGRHTSTLQLTVVAGPWKSTAPAVTSTLLLVIILLIFVFLWIRGKRASKQPSEPGERPDNGLQLNPGHVCDTSAAAQTQPTEQQDDLDYATIHFSKIRPDPLYSNFKLQRREEEEETVQYAAVKFRRPQTAPGSQEADEDPSELYSTVQKPHTNPRGHIHKAF